MSITLGELAVQFGCTLRGDPDVVVDHVATLESADKTALSFLANAKYRIHLTTTRAAVVVLDDASANECPVAVLISKQPYVTYARIAAVLHPPSQPKAGSHVSAVIASNAAVDNTADMGACVVIGEHAIIHADVVIG